MTILERRVWALGGEKKRCANPRSPKAEMGNNRIAALAGEASIIIA
jgi:hypothetical protein